MLVNPLVMQIAHAAQLTAAPDIDDVDRVTHVLAALKALKMIGYASTTCSNIATKVSLSKKAISAMNLLQLRKSKQSKNRLAQLAFKFALVPSDYEYNAALQHSGTYLDLFEDHPQFITGMLGQLGNLLNSVAAEELKLVGPDKKGGLVFRNETGEGDFLWFFLKTKPTTTVTPIDVDYLLAGCPVDDRNLVWPLECEEATLH